ncbi:helix-turn-helix domain-containing protein [Flavobacterium sp. I3-2]|uniref:helix-turn-helix domain-containing protein n=1 Tax=Flavobacterium sp. I3-2 TaxID=2748319 RepID=UPI0015AB75DC|nr:helix-turn-helix domain-containing protein [Flavobacterium sp. I3-2]
MENMLTKDDLRQLRILIVNDIKEFLEIEIKKTNEDDLNSEWLRSKSVRKFLDISPGTLQNLRISGKIQFKQIMGSYYYKKSDLINMFK